MVTLVNITPADTYVLVLNSSAGPPPFVFAFIIDLAAYKPPQDSVSTLSSISKFDTAFPSKHTEITCPNSHEPPLLSLIC